MLEKLSPNLWYSSAGCTFPQTIARRINLSAVHLFPTGCCSILIGQSPKKLLHDWLHPKNAKDMHWSAKFSHLSAVCSVSDLDGCNSLWDLEVSRFCLHASKCKAWSFDIWETGENSARKLRVAICLFFQSLQFILSRIVTLKPSLSHSMIKIKFYSQHIFTYMQRTFEKCRHDVFCKAFFISEGHLKRHDVFCNSFQVAVNFVWDCHLHQNVKLF